MTPLLSVVIPTRNRQKYCIAAIDNILSYDYPALELCIQDNSDDDQIEKYIATRKPDSRLVYKRVPEQIASIFNINDSVKLATGEYVILLGDDDTILPNIFKVVEWAKREGIDSICPTIFISYLWPGASPDREDGVLIVPYFTNTTSTININHNLNELFKQGIVNYHFYNLPKVYHGIVKRDLLVKVEKIMGSYFTGLSPDISGCVALSTVAQNHIVLDCPVTVAGACKSSTTSQNMNKGHRGALSSAPHLNLRGEYHWDKMVPPFYSVETIWADSALHTVDAMQIKGLREEFNYYRLTTNALINNRSILNFALKQVFNDRNNPKNKNSFLTLTCVGWYSQRIFLKKILRKFKRKLNINVREFGNIIDINMAVKTCVGLEKRLLGDE